MHLKSGHTVRLLANRKNVSGKIRHHNFYRFHGTHAPESFLFVFLLLPVNDDDDVGGGVAIRFVSFVSGRAIITRVRVPRKFVL